jgi:hypothetical protein
MPIMSRLCAIVTSSKPALRTARKIRSLAACAANMSRVAQRDPFEVD